MRGVRRDLARIKTILREKEVRAGDEMSVKAQVTGTVVSDKMDKTVVVAVERQVRHEVYGKTQRKTSKFVAHNENNEAKVGDTVAIAESRPHDHRLHDLALLHGAIGRRFLHRRRDDVAEAGVAPGRTTDRD